MGNLIELDPLELDQRYAVYSVRNTLEDGLIYDVGVTDPGFPGFHPTCGHSTSKVAFCGHSTLKVAFKAAFYDGEL